MQIGWKSSELRQVCRVREKTRFRRANAVSARSHAPMFAREAAVHVVSDAVAAALPDHDSEAPLCREQTGQPICRNLTLATARFFVESALFCTLTTPCILSWRHER